MDGLNMTKVREVVQEDCTEDVRGAVLTNDYICTMNSMGRTNANDNKVRHVVKRCEVRNIVQ